MNSLPLISLLSALSLALLTSACKSDDVVLPPAPVVTNSVIYRLSGTAITATSVTATYTNNILTVTGGTTPHSLTIQLTNPTTSGTITNGTIIYAIGSDRWSSAVSGGSSSVELTVLNTVTQKVSGTFTATLQPDGGGATGTQTITNGSFTDVSY